MAKKRKKDAPKLGQFVKIPAILQNTREGRPKLNAVEMMLTAIIHDWTNGGRGRYNYQSSKELARLLGSSDKTVSNALHRLRALRLVNWYSFPHGVGVKHLRFGNDANLRRWASSEKINEPTPAELAKAAQFTDVEILIRDVCEKPKSLGFDVWRACCDYCEFQTDKPKEKAVFEAAPIHHTTTDVMQPGEPLPYKSAEFVEAWNEWKTFRRSKGKALTGSAEKIALEDLTAQSEDEQNAIDAIRSAIAGGFMSLRPDIARTKAGGTAPQMPVNAWEWVKRKANERKRQPDDEAEVVEWLKEFRELHPGAPAWVEYNKHKREWAFPGFMAATPGDMPLKFKRAFNAYESMRREPDGEEKFYSAENMEARWQNAKENFKAAEDAERQKRSKQNQEIEAEFRRQLEARGYVVGDFSNENHKILEEVRREYPEHIDDVERVEKLKQNEAEEARRQKRYESLFSFGWDPAKPNSEGNREAYAKSQEAHPDIW